MIRFAAWTGTDALLRGGKRRLASVLGGMSLMLVLAGCGDIVPSTNTYPVDFFSEMHYSKAWSAGEPDGWNPPAGSVPITGGEVGYTLEESAELENPFDANQELGQRVYAINCAHCHGPEGAGDGIVSNIFVGYDGTPAANLQESVLADGEKFWVVTHGIDPHMPAFGRLLTQEQRWAVVEYIRTFEQ